MAYMLVRHKVGNYSNWRSAFDASLDARHRAGEQSCRMFRDAEEEGVVTLLHEWDSIDHARRYVQSPELQQMLKSAGVVDKPEVRYLAEMYTIRRSAAD
jgi:quinol monooxygenase YgiN